MKESLQNKKIVTKFWLKRRKTGWYSCQVRLGWYNGTVRGVAQPG